MQKVSKGEVVAARIAPGAKPPFLKHIPEFRRYDNKTAKSIHIGSDMYKKSQNLPVLEVQPGVACGGCYEP